MSAQARCPGVDVTDTVTEAGANVTDLRPGEAIRYYEQRHARGKVVITV
jgi:hypothetical protein